MNKPVLYAVLKLITEVEVKDLSGQKHRVKINGIVGYIPVFDNIEDAEKEREGKCEIVAIRTL